MLVSFTRKGKWQQKVERAVKSAKDGPNIAAFAAKQPFATYVVSQRWQRYCFECETVRPVTESLIASRHSYEEAEEKEDAADEVHSEKER